MLPSSRNFCFTICKIAQYGKKYFSLKMAYNFMLFHLGTLPLVPVPAPHLLYFPLLLCLCVSITADMRLGLARLPKFLALCLPFANKELQICSIITNSHILYIVHKAHFLRL